MKKTEYEDIDYVEIYIKNDSLNLCSERFGTIQKLKIFLSNDSLYFYSKKKSNYRGKVFNQTRTSFDLGEDSSNKRTYYKLNNSQNLEEYEKLEITEIELYKALSERRNRIYKRLGIK